MSKEKVIVDAIVSGTEQLLKSKKVQKFLCGSYSDGSPRSLPDALNDELLSPKQRQNKKAVKKHKKKYKKNKKKKSVTFDL
mgnify:CR=1 FL=1